MIQQKLDNWPSRCHCKLARQSRCQTKSMLVVLLT